MQTANNRRTLRDTLSALSVRMGTPTFGDGRVHESTLPRIPQNRVDYRASAKRAAAADPLFLGITRIVRNMAKKHEHSPNDDGTVVGKIVVGPRTVYIRWFNRTDADDIISTAYGTVFGWMTVGYRSGPRKGSVLSPTDPYFWGIVRRTVLNTLRTKLVVNPPKEGGVERPVNPETDRCDIRDLFGNAADGLGRTLTDDEQQVLVGLGLGRTARMIAEQVGVHESTISRTIDRLRLAISPDMVVGAMDRHYDPPIPAGEESAEWNGSEWIPR